MAWAVAAVGLVGAGAGIYKTIQSSHDAKKAREQQERLNKPFYDVQDEYYKNQRLGEGLATSGYTSAAKNYLSERAGAGLGSGISAIENTGGSANDISKLYSTYQDSLRTNAASDSQLQIENIKNLMSINKDIAGQKTTKWSLDKDRDYQSKLKEAKMTQQIADQNKWAGISETIGSIGSTVAGLSNANLIPKDQNPGPAARDSIATTPVATETSMAEPPGIRQSSWSQFFGQ